MAAPEDTCGGCWNDADYCTCVPIKRTPGSNAVGAALEELESAIADRGRTNCDDLVGLIKTADRIRLACQGLSEELARESNSHKKALIAWAQGRK